MTITFIKRINLLNLNSAAQCSTEAFKLATTCYRNMEDYTMFTQTEGVYSYTFQCEKKEDCLICGKTRKVWLSQITDHSWDIFAH